jgi:transforming growth factor-beta-induced protein
MKTEIMDSVNGYNVAISVGRNSTRFLINNARITTFNIMASNGVIHLIDKVNFPPKDLVEKIKVESQLSTLAKAIKAAKLESTLSRGSTDTDYTIFAPTNRAFQALGTDALDSLLKDPEKLKSILLYHTIKGSKLKSSLDGKGSVNSVQGSKIQFDGRTSGLLINDAEVTEANILSANGIIHIIDKVLTIPS